MPSKGGHSSEVMDEVRGYFQNGHTSADFQISVRGSTWQVVQCPAAWGAHYGVFDGDEPLAHALIEPPGSPATEDDPDQWRVASTRVAPRFRGDGAAGKLLTAWVQQRNLILASDLNQTAGGAGVWKQIIRLGALTFDLWQFGNATTVPVSDLGGVPSPDPWAQAHWKHRIRAIP